MAQVIPCDTCNEFAASCMLTLIAEADVKGFCPDCFADFAEAFLKEVRPEVFTRPPAAARRGRGKKAAADGQAADQGGQDDATGGPQETGQAAGVGQGGDGAPGAADGS